MRILILYSLLAALILGLCAVYGGISAIILVGSLTLVLFVLLAASVVIN